MNDWNPTEDRVLVSVVVPVYNDQERLYICLAALAQQTLPNSTWEVIVVDNGSQPEIVAPHTRSLNLKMARCPKPGSYAARNVGVRLARGEVIAFLDADLVPAPHWLETGLKAIRSAPVRTLIGGAVRFVPSEKPGAVELFQQIRIGGQQDNIEKRRFSGAGNLFVRKQDVLEVGSFNETLYSGGDKEWSWRAVDRGFDLLFCPQAEVSATHRNSLAAAIRYTRRVTGGRFQMRRSNVRMPSAIAPALPPSRSSVQTFLRTLGQSGLPRRDQVRVLAVAVVLKCVETVEMLRLKTGLATEERA